MPRRRAPVEAKKCAPPPLDIPTADEKRESIEDAMRVPRGWLRREFRLVRAIQEADSKGLERRELIRRLCEERGRPMGEIFAPNQGWAVVAEVLREMLALGKGNGDVRPTGNGGGK